MNQGGATVKFLLLSEDSSASWPVVQQRIVRLLLRSIDEQADLTRVTFDPIDNADARAAMRANRWREHKPNAPSAENLRLLLRSIATHIARSTHFCSFHYDGDTTWERRADSASDAQFEAIVGARLRQTLTQWLDSNHVAAEERDQRVARMLERLLPIVPHYSIESWLFQNTDELRVACQRSGAQANVVAECAARCDAWSEDRSLLDEVAKVKETVCAKDTANEALATTLSNQTFAAVVEAGKSLAATRDRWAQREQLRESLASIRR